MEALSTMTTRAKRLSTPLLAPPRWAKQALPRRLARIILGLTLLALLLSALLLPFNASAQGQAQRYASRQAGPISVAGASGEQVWLSSAEGLPAELSTIITLRLKGATLEQALKRIAEEADLELIYGSEKVSVREKVSLSAEQVTAREALRRVLRGTGLWLMKLAGGQLVVVDQAEDAALEKISLEAIQLSKVDVPARLQPAGRLTGTISGTVTDSASGEPLPGVNVVIAGTQQGAATVADGTYQIPGVEAGTYTVRASFVGYGEEAEEGVEVTDGETTTVNFALQPEAQGLDEVVVVGYGTQERERITSSVSSVQADDFVQGSVRDAASLLEGKVAGLNITNPGGNPTSNSEISLRGISSLLGSSDPLVLIDGVPGDLRSVAPQMIASVSVLKSGSAAAIYGSRASNGVILIETKNYQGEQIAIQYEAYVSNDRISRKPDFLDASDYERLISEGYEFTDYGYNTNWQDQVLRQPISYMHDLTLSGGTGNTGYIASLNYEDAQGIFRRSYNEEATGRISIDHSMFEDRLQANLNLIGRSQSYWNGFEDSYWRQALIRNPTDRVTTDEGIWQERNISNYYNPVGLIEESNGKDQVREFRFNGSVTWNLIETANIKLTGSHTNETLMSGYAETQEHISTRVQGENGYASRETSSETDQLLELTGTYEDIIKNHSFNLLGGYSYQRVAFEGFYANNTQFPTDLFGYDALETGNALRAGEANMGSDQSSFKVISFFSRLNYSWNDRYILMGSLRYEGSSKFGADRKWGLFPGLSAGWRISEESFMEDVSFVDDLKLRAGYGVTGNAPTDPYQSLTSYAYGDRFLYQGEYVQGISPTRNPNPDLHWERKEEVNLGIDVSMLDERLSGSIDVYRRKTEDMLWNYNVPVPPYLYESIIANVGAMRNRGLEVALEYDVYQNEDFNWTTSANYSTNSNRLLSLSNELFETTNNYFDTGSAGDPIQMSTHRVEVGKSIGNFYGYEAVDIDENGEWIILGSNGERMPIGEATLDEQRYLGNGIPSHHLSWNHSGRYRNFDFQINMRGAFGFQILNFTRMHHENPTVVGENVLEEAYDAVYGKQQLAYPLTYVSHYLESGDYWKIGSVTLGYTLGLDRLGPISDARVYLSGRNLYTFTGYQGIDPEVSSAGLTPGNDRRLKYPSTRTYTLGINLSF